MNWSLTRYAWWRRLCVRHPGVRDAAVWLGARAGSAFYLGRLWLRGWLP